MKKNKFIFLILGVLCVILMLTTACDSYSIVDPVPVHYYTTPYYQTYPIYRPYHIPPPPPVHHHNHGGHFRNGRH